MLAKLERRPPCAIFTRSLVAESYAPRDGAHDRLARAFDGLVMDRVSERDRRARNGEQRDSGE